MSKLAKLTEFEFPTLTLVALSLPLSVTMGNKHNQAKRLAKKRAAVSKARDPATGSSRTPAQPETTLSAADHCSHNDAVKLTLRIPRPRNRSAQDELEPEGK